MGQVFVWLCGKTAKKQQEQVNVGWLQPNEEYSHSAMTFYTNVLD